MLLTDPAVGHDIVVAKADIAEDSPMPAAYETLLSEGELLDLVGFLKSGR